MSNPQEIFTQVSSLKGYSLWLGNYEIFVEDTVSLEIKWDFNNFPIGGTLIVKDSVEMSNLNIFNGNTTFKIKSQDFFGNNFYRTFMVTGIKQDLYNNQFKVFSFEFVDFIYFKLVNTYLSKSFTDTLPNIISSYFTQLGIDNIITSESLTKNFDAGTVESLVVPQNISAYEFFEFQLRNDGLRMWQDRDSINVKAIDLNKQPEIQDSSGNPIIYSNNTKNMYYGFKIFDYSIGYNNILKLNEEEPIQLNYRYDITKKNLVDATVNLTDMYSTIELSDEVLNTDYQLQFTNGRKYTYQETLQAQNLKLDLEDTYNNNNNLDIVVPGNYSKNKPGYIINLEFKGNPMIQNTAMQGDIFHSGKYFINSVTDRYINDKLIQKLSVGRIGFQKPRG